MMVEAVYKLLSQASAIASLVGNHIHYAQAPQGQTQPYLVLQHAGLTGEQFHGGSSDFHTGIIRVSAIAPTYLGAADLARAVRQTLNGYSGEVVTNESTLRIAYIALEDEDEIPAILAEGQSQPRAYGRSIDFRYGIHEPAPAGAQEES